MGYLDFFNEAVNNGDTGENNRDDKTISSDISYKVYSDGIVDVTEALVMNAFKEASIKYTDAVTVDAIISYFENKESGGYSLKNTIKRIMAAVYGEDSSDYISIAKIVDSNMKNDNFQFFREKIFINQLGAGGIALSDVIPPEPISVPEIIDDEPYGSSFEPEQPYETDGNTVPDEEELNEASNDEDNFQRALDTYISEMLKNESDNKPVFEPESIPHDLTEAQDYYDSVKDSICSADDEANNAGIYFETERRNEIVENVDITVNNNIKATIDLKQEDDVCTDFCMILDLNGQVVLLGSFIYKMGEYDAYSRYYLEAYSKNIDFSSIRKAGSKYKLFWVNNKKNHYYSGSICLSLKTVETSDKTLCIDFGTSNTTAGIYTDKGIHTVKFQNVTVPEHEFSNLCPTIVYINKIVKKDNATDVAEEVDYYFGYDAKKILFDNSFNPAGKMLFDIKRWIISPYKYEEISDGQTEAIIKRSEVIKAYLLYILRCSENYFRCRFKKLHFSAPVKLKSDFIGFLKSDVFNDEKYYVMNAEESIDEGVAIVYNHIANSIFETERTVTKQEDHDMDDFSKSESIIIIDCGGGTTDLVNCSYSYHKTESGYELDLHNKFVNGNSNFGGNNITYRIFQLLKIKLADYYKSVLDPSSKNSFDGIDKLINSNQNDILNIIDTAIKKNESIRIYDQLDEKSRLAEDTIPTDFNGNNNYTGIKTHPQVMRNFFLLWQLAEEVKIEFFSRTDCAYINLNSANDIISIEPKDKFFYIKNPKSPYPPLIATNQIEGMKLLPKVEINTNEITTLIRPDIYYLLSTICDFENISYNKIKLSGQSCQINLFLDLLKEFVPGQKLRSKKVTGYGNESGNNDKLSGMYKSISEKMKMRCIEGCIAYVRDMELHVINPNNFQESQSVNYNVFISRSSESGIFSTALFSSKAFENKNASEELHIEQYNATNGKMYIYVTKDNDKERVVKTGKPVEIPLLCNIGDAVPIKLENDINGDKTLRSDIIMNSYYGIEEFNIKDCDGEEISIIDDLINKIKNTDIAEEDKKVLVFAVPNRDGYGFILYQVIKTKEDAFEKYYYSKICKPFEAGVMTRSFFNGNNCEASEDSGDGVNA